MTKRTTKTIAFTRCKRRKVQADFGGDEITSNAGVMLLGKVDDFKPEISSFYQFHETSEIEVHLVIGYSSVNHW